MTKPVAKKAGVPAIHVDYQSIISQVEKEHGLNATELNKEVYRKCAVSTGILMVDLMTGGGIQPAWNTFWGGEGAGKTTVVESVSANAMTVQIPLFNYWDFEQALDIEKFQNICQIISPDANFDRIFGLRNLKDPSKFDIQPLIHYYPHDVGEDFYLAMGSMLRMLPDKQNIGGTWYLVFPNTKASKAIVGTSYDKNMFRQYGKYYVVAPDGGRLQAVMIVDSIQAMNPEQQETGDLKKQMAQDASMHAKHLKKVRGKLRRKHAAVLAIGQLRHNPGQMFGNPEYTPGGNALKHASDVRQKQTARSSPNGGGPVESEASVLIDGAIDQYKYIHVKNEKNKFFTPHTEGWMRVWIDHEGQARGFDPVYDCYQFLRGTGRIIGKLGCGKGEVLKSFILHWPEIGFNNKKITWLDFKAFVLYDIFNMREELKTLCTDYDTRVEGKLRNPKIRGSCFLDMREGNAFEAFQQIRAGIFGNEDGEDEEEEFEDDEEYEDEDEEEDE